MPDDLMSTGRCPSSNNTSSRWPFTTPARSDVLFQPPTACSGRPLDAGWGGILSSREIRETRHNIGGPLQAFRGTWRTRVGPIPSCISRTKWKSVPVPCSHQNRHFIPSSIRDDNRAKCSAAWLAGGNTGKFVHTVEVNTFVQSEENAKARLRKLE